MNSWMRPSILPTSISLISSISNTVDRLIMSNNSKNQNIPQPHRLWSKICLRPILTRGRITLSMRGRYRRWRCRIRSMRDCFRIAVIIIKLEAMGSRLLLSLLFPREIGFRVRIIPIRMLVFPLTLPFLRGGGSRNPFRIRLWGMISFSSKRRRRISERIYGNSSSRCSNSKG